MPSRRLTWYQGVHPSPIPPLPLLTVLHNLCGNALQARVVINQGSGVAKAFVGRTRGGVHRLDHMSGSKGAAVADTSAQLLLAAETAATASTAALVLGNAEQSASLLHRAAQLWAAASDVPTTSAAALLPSALAHLKRSVTEFTRSKAPKRKAVSWLHALTTDGTCVAWLNARL